MTVSCHGRGSGARSCSSVKPGLKFSCQKASLRTLMDQWIPQIATHFCPISNSSPTAQLLPFPGSHCQSSSRIDQICRASRPIRSRVGSLPDVYVIPRDRRQRVSEKSINESCPLSWRREPSPHHGATPNRTRRSHSGSIPKAIVQVCLRLA
jgi:hypothetical protein